MQTETKATTPRKGNALSDFFPGNAATIAGGQRKTSANPADVPPMPQKLFGIDDNVIMQVVAALLRALPKAAVSPITDNQAADKGDFRTDYDLRPGDHEVFPTWSFWGTTTVRVDNVSSIPSTLILQAAAAAPETHHLNPGEGKTIRRQWWGFPVNVMNSSEHGDSVLRVRVW